MADSLGTDNNAPAPLRQGRPLSQHSTMDYDEKEDDIGIVDKAPSDEGEQTATHGRLLLFIDDSDGVEDDDAVEANEDVEDTERGSGDQNEEKMVDEGENGGNRAAADVTATSAPATGGAATREEISEPVEEIILPLLDYLCTFNDCSLKELQVLFHSVQARQRMVAHLQHNCHLRTAHLKPPERNVGLHCHDLSAQNANRTFACGGYLELTVRQYYFAKHGLKLKHPYLPCMIEFGGGAHASYYPLELVHVIVEHPKQQGPHAVSFLKRLNRNNNNVSSCSSNAGVADETATDAGLSGGRTVAEDAITPLLLLLLLLRLYQRGNAPKTMVYVQNSTATFALFATDCGQFSRDQFLAIARHGCCTEYAPWRFHAIVLRVRLAPAAQQTPDGGGGMASGTATALLFRSGRVVLTGVRGQHHQGLRQALCSAARRVCRRVRAALRASRFCQYATLLGVHQLTIRNLVSTLHVSHRVAVERLYSALCRWRSHRSAHTHPDNNEDDVSSGDHNGERVSSGVGFAGTRFVGVSRCCLDLSTFPALRCTLLLLLMPAERPQQQQLQEQQQQPHTVSVTCLVFISGRAIVTGVRHLSILEQAFENLDALLAAYAR
ncbi:hypothetical protein GPALN_012315 [Globodera pallida]|nr:hypothetical protein GPALN_012315 [Globodera pallida]